MASAPDDIHSSHYALLGVPLDADIGQIRGAYLRLMKMAHPDLRRRRARRSPDPTALNEAYRVLRDPRRRMAYDLTLRRSGHERPGWDSSAGGSMVRIARRMPPPPPPASLSRRLAMGFCILLVGGAAGLFLSLPQPAGSRAPTLMMANPAAAPIGGGDVMASPARADVVPTNLWVDGQMVTRAVDHLIWIRRFGRPVDALRYSRTCFEELGSMPSSLLLDHCVAFDLAAASWLNGRSSAVVGFSAREVQARHRAALAGLAEADTRHGQRLGDIKQATVAALVRRIDPQAAPAPEEMIFPADPPPRP